MISNDHYIASRIVILNCFQKQDTPIIMSVWCNNQFWPWENLDTPHFGGSLLGADSLKVDFANTILTPHPLTSRPGHRPEMALQCAFKSACKMRHLHYKVLTPDANLGGFGLLRNVGKSIFEIVGQAGVFPVIFPYGAKMALGWPTGENR